MRKAELLALISDFSLGSISKSPSIPPAPKPGPRIGSPPSSKPKSGLSLGGSSPSKPKSPVNVPPKAPKLPNLPKLPKLPKPGSGSKLPKCSIPGYIPGYPPHHGSGRHSSGGQNQGNGHTSPVESCIHPKGFARLRCEKPDAIVVTILAIMALILAPFFIYLCIRSGKRRKNKRKNGHEEDAVELTGRVYNCDPSPQIDRGVVDGASNIGLAISTSEETFTLAKEQPEGQSSGTRPGREPSPVRQPGASSSTRGRESTQEYPPRSSLIREGRLGSILSHVRLESSLSRGRPAYRAESLRSVASSLSSGMIRTAILGQALQDPTIVDVPPSLASSRKNSERMCSVSDADRFSGFCSSGNGGRDVGDNDVEGDSRHQEAECRSRSSGHQSSSHEVGGQSESNVASPDEPASTFIQ